MIVCPICGVYWDYVSSLTKDLDHYEYLVERYKTKEQGDCIIHVSSQHSNEVLIEILSNEIDQIKKLIIAK